MKNAILLYNPKAGNRQIINHLDFIIKRMQSMGYSLRMYRSEYKGAIEQYITENLTNENIDIILISGGDGTLNECINGIIKAQLNVPMLILPLGTANDFAYSAHIPGIIEEALNLLEDGTPEYVDIGKANDKYFINVCNMGLFSGVSHNIDLELKKKFGKLAYYVKSLEELHNYKSMQMSIEVDGQNLQDEYVLVLIFNGKAAGGFTRLAKNADIRDGLFDLICIKKVDLYEVPILFLKVLQGEHLEDQRIDYLTGRDIKLECHNTEANFATDLDGEMGPSFPIHISMEQQVIQIYLPKSTEE